MKNILTIIVLGLILGSTSSQALLIETTGSTGGEAAGTPIYQDLYSATIDGTTDVGSSFTLDWGYGVDPLNSGAFLSAQTTFTVSSFLDHELIGGIYDSFIFNIDIANLSTVDSSILSFGFNTNPDLTGAGLITGDVFTAIGTDQNFPSFHEIDLCVFVLNCAGGPYNDGLQSGTSDQLTVLLYGNFHEDSITLSDFPVKFQGDYGSFELPGQSVSVPEPESLALMGLALLGLSFSGWKNRDRK